MSQRTVKHLEKEDLVNEILGDMEVDELQDVARAGIDIPKGGIPLAGLAQRVQNQKRTEHEEAKRSFKLYMFLTKRIKHYEAQKTRLLNNGILPHVKKELKFLKNLHGRDHISLDRERKKYLTSVTGNKDSAAAFYKKKLKHLE